MSRWQPDGTFRADSTGLMAPLARPTQDTNNRATLSSECYAYVDKGNPAEKVTRWEGKR